MADIIIAYTVPFNTNVRVGYKIKASSDPFTYLSIYPSYAQSPYTITGLTAAILYEIELTTICPNCSGSNYSDPVLVEGLAT
jgi:hypothetical protein